MSGILSVREIKQRDIIPLSDYWFTASAEFLHSMGADIKKLPTREQWYKMLEEQLSQPYTEKKAYCIIWELDGKAVGHSNINRILFGQEAYMHLHLWNNPNRQKGIGTQLVKLTLPYFFNNMQLQKLYCEPYALNPAPNKTLEKVGFTFVKKHITVPGFINFEQEANLWELTKEQLKKVLQD